MLHGNGIKSAGLRNNNGIRITETVLRKIGEPSKMGIELKEVEIPERRVNVYEVTRMRPSAGIAVSESEHFADRLFQRMERLNTRVCVGLDPDLSRFPVELIEKYSLSEKYDNFRDSNYLRRAADCIIDFNKMVIDAIGVYAAAVKPQSAHYERFGQYGIEALYHTVCYARSKGLIVILDAKRNDIGATAEKYALAYLGADQGPESAAIPCDAITINPYLGKDGVIPFVELCSKNGKGIFILTKTSNPSSADLQDMHLHGEGQTLAHQVASLVNKWGEKVTGQRGYSAVGAVVGATHPAAVQALRRIMPHNVFLMPGYGAQGGTAKNVRAAFDPDGLGALINSSRGIIYAYPREATDFRIRIKEAANSMREDLNRVIQT